MGRLIHDISSFLSSRCFRFFHLEQCGCEIICVNLESGHQRIILPIEISAKTQEDARCQAMHLEKSIKCLYSQDSEYPLIVTEDRWNVQNEMMKARILSHLEVFSPVYARNCEIRRIDKSVAKEFLETNHSYGHAACKYCYGLFFKRYTGHIANEIVSSEITDKPLHIPGQLVAVATFSNARKWIKGEQTIRSYEWTRYASLPNVRLSGGMGRMLKTFIKEVHPDDIMSYSDLEWSAGDVYTKLGFELEGQKAPVIFCVDTESWKRAPIKPSIAGGTSEISAPTYFQNFGSNKYRLKLTDYK